MMQSQSITDAIRSATAQAARAAQHADELAANFEALASRGEATTHNLTNAREAAEQAGQVADSAAAGIAAAATSALTPVREDLEAVEAGRAAINAFRCGDDPLVAWSANIGSHLWNAAEKLPPEPPAVLWRYQDGDDLSQPPPPGRLLLAAKAVGVLSGEGGIGKSSLAQQIALAAAAQTPTGAGLGDIGLAVAPGPVLLWQLEDKEAVVRHRLSATADRWNIGNEAQGRVIGAAADKATELWRSTEYHPSRPGPTLGFAALAAAVATRRPRLVIIDPVSCAVLCAQSDLLTVRAFIAAAARMVGPNSAVLLVAHPTKEARANAEGGPGIVSGTAAWFDACRVVIHARRPRDSKGRVREAHRQQVLLEAAKVNLGIEGPIGPGPLQVTVSGRWPAGLMPSPSVAVSTKGEAPSLSSVGELF